MNHIWVNPGTTFITASTVIPQLKNHFSLLGQVKLVLQCCLFQNLWPFLQSVAIPQTAGVCFRLFFFSFFFFSSYHNSFIITKLENYSCFHPPTWCITTAFELTLADLQVLIGPKPVGPVSPTAQSLHVKSTKNACASKTQAVNVHNLLKMCMSAGPSTSGSLKAGQDLD